MRRCGTSSSDRRARLLALVTLGTAAIGRGAAYLAPDYQTTSHLHMIELLVPIAVWAVVWLTIGAALLAGIWCPRIARWAMAASTSLWAVWALSYGFAQAFTAAERAWVTAVSLATLAVCNAILLYLMQPIEKRAVEKRGAG